MHELAITEGIIEAAVPAAIKNGAEKILEIRIRIGELSGVVPECILEYFDMASRGTIAEGAEIVFETIPATITCKDCGYDGVISRGSYTCPQCGSAAFSLTGGREFYVESLRVE
ncbi:MAG: hydrogenase maturation nickel metallochaperone HypA [Lachnospiraceae bacterium]|nr:hydrogenase maturation nickel metallochaperone HypA [Lachnospiraceae bacterium]